MHEIIIRKIKKRKVYSFFKDYVCGADCANMQLISKFNKGFRFLLYVTDIYNNYVWVVSFKDKMGITIVKVFQQIAVESNRKANKIWVDKCSKVFNRTNKSRLYRVIKLKYI